MSQDYNLIIIIIIIKRFVCCHRPQIDSEIAIKKTQNVHTIIEAFENIFR